MTQNYNLQELDISSDWTVLRNVFYVIDPLDLVSDDDKYDHIYHQEDLLYLIKGNYHLDLGWYGSDLTDEASGYCIHLFRGENWLVAELLEKFRSRSQNAIANKIHEFAKAVELGEYDKLSGYLVDENDPSNKNNFSDFDTYSVMLTK